jgi:hypothetical protein
MSAVEVTEWAIAVGGVAMAIGLCGFMAFFMWVAFGEVFRK